VIGVSAYIEIVSDFQIHLPLEYKVFLGVPEVKHRVASGDFPVMGGEQFMSSFPSRGKVGDMTEFLQRRQ
jgi:hypothetical protein